MFEIALYEPEIPPNTGNIIRLCANTGCRLHLIHPLGFSLDEKSVRRAGLDYRDMANVQEYEDFSSFLSTIQDKTLYALTTKGKQNYVEVTFNAGDVLLFGPETRGLPDSLLAENDSQALTIPQKSGRSLNLATSVGITLYEAVRQLSISD
jgi:tRNA (cytidine/uridine-2'-O-)-methyltransferase